MALISTRALTKRYPRGVTALDGLSVEIGEGVIGLVGANGAGKSTLIVLVKLVVAWVLARSSWRRRRSWPG